MGDLFQIASIFDHHMVLQRGMNLPIWGSGMDGKKVTVELANQSHSAVIKNGRWQVMATPLALGAPMDLVVTCEKEKIILTDVLVGDVYLAGGQSNMAMPMRVSKGTTTIEQANYTQIRIFDIPGKAFPGSTLFIGGDGTNDIWEIKQTYQQWQLVTPESVLTFSAVGFSFAQQIHMETGVPIGIISCNWGGKSASCWMTSDYFNRDSGLKEFYEAYSNQLAKVNDTQYAVEFEQYSLAMAKFIAGKAELPNEPFGKYHSSRPGGLYEGMLSEVFPFAIKAVLWYQGESDDLNHGIYEAMLTQMIACWRDSFGIPNLPFLLVQLPSFEVNNRDPLLWGYLREAQARVSMNPNVYMAVTMDAGERCDIHPKNKAIIANRLALLAKKYLYGINVIADSPKAIEMKTIDNELHITFDRSDIVCYSDKVLDVLLTCNGSIITPIYAHVKHGKLIVGGTASLNCSALYYGYSSYSQANLYHASGIMVAPFKFQLK